MRNKVVLVSGGGGGIGLEVCKLLSDDPEIAEIVIAQRNPPKDAVTTLLCGKVKVSFIAVDLNNLDGVTAFAAEVASRYDKIDYLVLTAGVCPRDHHTTLTPENFSTLMQEVTNVNVFGPILIIKALFPLLLKGRAGNKDGGGIVAVSSLAAAIGGVVTFIGYDLAKGGLEACVRHFSRHCFDPEKPDGARIHILAVAPGPVETEMLATMPPDKVASMKASTRTLKLAGATEVASQIVLGLKTPALTGQVIHMNGGALCGK